LLMSLHYNSLPFLLAYNLREEQQILGIYL
jgi:hypothetical protein